MGLSLLIVHTIIWVKIFKLFFRLMIISWTLRHYYPVILMIGKQDAWHPMISNGCLCIKSQEPKEGLWVLDLDKVAPPSWAQTLEGSLVPLVATAAAMHLRPGGLSTLADATEPVEWVAYYAEVTQPQLRSGGSQLSTDNWLFCCWFGKLWSRSPDELLNELGLWVIKSRELSL